jgi:hypothetical protein
MIVDGLLNEDFLAVITSRSNGELIATSAIRDDLHTIFGLSRYT